MTTIDRRTSTWSTMCTVFAFSCFTYAIMSNHSRKTGLTAVLSGELPPGPLFVAPGSSAAGPDKACVGEPQALPLYRLSLAQSVPDQQRPPGQVALAAGEESSCGRPDEAVRAEEKTVLPAVLPRQKTCKDLHREAFLDADRDGNGALDTTEFYSWWLRACKLPDDK
jgi:hypothetical protein